MSSLSLGAARTLPSANFKSQAAEIHSEDLSKFEVGEKAVYGVHGVVTIEDIQECNVGGTRQDFYVASIVSTGARVMVPTGAARSAGLRAVVRKNEVQEKVFDVISGEAKHSTATWNRRFRTFNEKLSKGDVSAVAEVFRDLSSLGAKKELSFGERKMLDRARQMLTTEIAIAHSCTEVDAEEELHQILGQAHPIATTPLRGAVLRKKVSNRLTEPATAARVS